mmetsp:Transcript_78346/g.227322  ORF Transcript_78346/g.227322 Transcript_78346/m.227322 type:complete len:228 (-) Transcript_78346:236-919(-)
MAEGAAFHLFLALVPHKRALRRRRQPAAMGFGDASAKEKKAAKAAMAEGAAKKAAEDAAWDDNDKNLKGKASRAAAKDEKADAKLAAKKERAELEAAEEAENSKLSGANKKAAPSKVTQAEIARRQALLAMSKATAKKSAKSEVVSQPKLEANTNRQADVDATGIDAALDALGGTPEKKTKMTYKEYEAKVLPDVQAENPGLKMSQAKDKVFKMWERAPENPKNQEK